MNTITFTKDDFPFLSMSEDLVPGGQMVGSDILGDEAEGLLLLAAHLGSPIEDFDEQALIYAVADQDGILKNVYSPSLWQNNVLNDEGAIVKSFPVIRIGNNLYPVQIDKGVLTCGVNGLSADGLETEIAENLKKEKYLRASATFATSDGETLFVVDVRLDGEKASTQTEKECKAFQQKIKAAVKAGSLDEYLMAIGSGGTETTTMQQLGVGEFVVESITELDFRDSADNPRISYTLQLAGGFSVWARGNVATLLNDERKKWEVSLVKRGWATRQATGFQGDRTLSMLHLKQPVTLVIGSIEERSTGKFTVACKIVERAPKVLEGDSQGVAVIAAASTQKQIAGIELAGVDIKEPELLEAIPF